MGNEAIARGALEGGVSIVTGYPGTPSSEVLMTIHEFGRDLPIYAEWAINERVAFELALGAAIGGARAMVTMKAPGINVALDPIVSSAYSGVDGGLVILVADDPGPHTTQTEQDSRWLANLTKLPLISPANPQEAKDFTAMAFEISERLKLPVIIRTTTRVNHTVGEVILGDIKQPKRFINFERDPPRFVRAGMKWNLNRHKWLNNQLSKVEDLAEEFGLNKIYGSGEKCIITEGTAFNYVYEIVKKYDKLDNYKIVKLGLLYPLPTNLLKKVLPSCRKIIVVEELDPYIEQGIKKLIYQMRISVDVVGKEEGILPLEGELNSDLVGNALNKSFGLKYDITEIREIKVPSRPPPLCPSCPHRNSYIALLYGISKAGYRRSEVPIFGDIGCYALSVNPPINAIWTEHSMGASISMAMGLKSSGFKNPVVATIGDSTFFHSGIQPLIEAVHKEVDILVIILDNQVIAMTGHQSTPAWEITETGRKGKPVVIDQIVRSIGVENVAVVDPYNIDEMINIVSEYIKKPGVKVIIARHPCALMEARIKGVSRKYTVISEKCTGCMACIRITGCPALYVRDEKVSIMIEDCLGCGLCAKYCPYQAIIELGGEND
jgi:indolepyruvate ferredoxin oxidoreductase alpha subunit